MCRNSWQVHCKKRSSILRFAPTGEVEDRPLADFACRTSQAASRSIRHSLICSCKDLSKSFSEQILILKSAPFSMVTVLLPCLNRLGDLSFSTTSVAFIRQNFQHRAAEFSGVDQKQGNSGYRWLRNRAQVTPSTISGSV